MALLTNDMQRVAESSGLVVRDNGCCVQVYDAAREDVMPLAVFSPPPAMPEDAIAMFANYMVAGCASMASAIPNRAEVGVEVGVAPDAAETGVELEIVTAQRYFWFDNGGARYWVVAESVTHALEILEWNGAIFENEDGVSVPFSALREENGEPIQLGELTDEEARTSRITGGIWDMPESRACLSDADPGDLFCSEH